MKKILLTVLLALNSPWLASAEIQDTQDEAEGSIVDILDVPQPTITLDAPFLEDTQSENEDSQTADADNNQEARDENFIPSVRIVEDLPVAFPVDI